MAARDRLTDFLTRHRGFIVLAFCLPLSYAFDRVRRAAAWARTRWRSAPARHDARVADVQRQVRVWQAAGRPRPMVTARPGYATMSLRNGQYKAACHRIRLDLRAILGLDTERGVVRVEPLVDMGQLTRFLLPRGWALAVHVEMEDLTIGGLVMGVGMETSSHRFGLIQETVEAYEIVLGDGSLVRATRTEHADLFHALPWSHGTLGFLVAVELRVVPVKPYVRLAYRPCQSLAELAEVTRRLAEAEAPPDFLETLVFSPSTGVVMSGELGEADTPAARARINPINRWHKPWFYKHVQSFLARGPGEEYVPLAHYYHRHTRSIFWAIEDMLPFCHAPLYRWCFGWLGAPKVSFLKLTMTPALRRETVERSVVQDVILPIAEMERAVTLFHELFEVYPLLVFPMRIYDHGGHGLLRPPPARLPGRDYQMFFDLGVYGVPGPVKRGEPWDARRAVRAMERYTRDVGGYQCLYADIFMTRSEFEEMFDHGHYRKMRARYGAEDAFPEVWDKVRAQW